MEANWFCGLILIIKIKIYMGGGGGLCALYREFRGTKLSLKIPLHSRYNLHITCGSTPARGFHKFDEVFADTVDAADVAA